MEALWLALIAITMVGVAVGHLPRLAMNRATICLVGATLLVQTGAISLEAAYRAIDLDTIVLLLAMMIINVNLRMAGFFRLAARWIVAGSLPPVWLLGAVMLASGVLSALFLNDTVVLAFTPLVLEVVLAMGLPSTPFLIGLATAANIGSVGTIIGNPQNMLIGMASGIGFQRFFFVLGPVAVGGLVIAWLVVVAMHWRELAASAPASAPAPVVALHRPLLWKSMAATLLMLAALLSGMPVALSALSAASLLLITRRHHPERVFQEVDWGLLVFFAALFVVTRAVETTGFSAHVLGVLAGGESLSIASLTGLGAVLSNLISNVPAVLLLRPVVELLSWREDAWLTLAMATTFAGNLTLLGSVANLIVAETAQRQGVRLSFVAYLRAGVPVTALTLLWGGWWLTP